MQYGEMFKILKLKKCRVACLSAQFLTQSSSPLSKFGGDASLLRCAQKIEYNEKGELYGREITPVHIRDRIRVCLEKLTNFQPVPER